MLVVVRSTSTYCDAPKILPDVESHGVVLFATGLRSSPTISKLELLVGAGPDPEQKSGLVITVTAPPVWKSAIDYCALPR